MSALEREMQRSRLSGGLPPMPPPGAGSNTRRSHMKKRDYTPVYWDNYFQTMHDIKVNEKNTFRVYACGSEGPVLFFLHGGGYSALSWAVLSSIISGLVKCRCAAIDLRGHGDTVTEDETDLSAETLSSDVGAVIETLYKDNPSPIILIGHSFLPQVLYGFGLANGLHSINGCSHTIPCKLQPPPQFFVENLYEGYKISYFSMGGSIAVHTAFRDLVPSLMGLVVIDVVEGTAMESLSSMQSFLRGRPTHFNSLEHAIEWCVRTGQVRNLESAKVSMVGQVRRMDTLETGTTELERAQVLGKSYIISEEDEKYEGAEGCSSHCNATNQKQNAKYTWRVDLSKTEKFWKGWFQGLSQKFLSCEVPKMLLLAGVDRLDKDLTIGQMQGKFQMQVLPQCGHSVHEDVPEKVADVLATFMVRHKVAEPAANFQSINRYHSSSVIIF